ncbi:MAG: type II toxin-antitoxin system VapC family toxin [Vicinamibacterales bacterium]
MTFIDTSAIYAWADTADPNHRTAVQRLQTLLESREELLTHNYVLVESVALLQARLGLTAAIKLARDSEAFVIEWVGKDLHTMGIRELHRSRKRRVSLVDHISFLVMKRRQVTTAFAFDPDFTAAGFRVL